ncbi:hypothetical protein FPZ12_017895 [Amycolatopsis acidicola]|uniref:Uncharacterized protein n=1 Tax=Amycolatopsis acidicola TaxID=2596893 RepID=A0A5N0V6T3_9PSEU|nr:hypothetical protein [Amycolatopsis acidicola]KAA9160222.1 hypothetical protein FPZ12_017895 [Amycolatopsis acidicola]
MNRIDWPRDTARRPVLAACAGLVAVLAYAGAAALITGVLGLGAEVTARLPWGSTVFAGVALALVVGVPMTVVACFGSRGNAYTSVAAVVAGSMLIGWIAVEIGFVRTYSWLQPVFAFAGLLIAHAGLRRFRRTS